MNDERLRSALRELPPAAPRPGFTQRVLARLERAPRRRPLRPLPAWVTAAAAVTVLAGGLWGAAAGRQALEQQKRRAALKQESAAIARELAALRAEAAKPAPMLYLGGSEQVDVVLDLASLPMAATVPAASDTRR
jgi:hypothetical protein